MLTAATRRAAVLGSPVSHSLSPVLHRAAYRALHLGDWSYDAQELEASQLPAFVAGLGPEWVGLSLTMPLKEAALEVADEVSDLAREVGAVNTLVRRSDGGWQGHNTDVYGVAQALREAGCEHVDSALVLGSGATARSVVAALAMLGCARVTFAVRAAARPETLDQAARAGLEVEVVALGQVAGVLGSSPVVVSTLPANAWADLVLPQGSQPPDHYLQHHLMLDVVYAGWPTPLARIFGAAGASVVSGFEMLLHQGAEQVHLMTGLRPHVDQMRVAGLAAMADPASR